MVDLLVDEMDGDPGELHPVGKRLRHGMGTRKGRQQGWMSVENAIGEPGHCNGSEDPHEAGEHERTGVVNARSVAAGNGEIVTVVVRVPRHDLRCHACRCGTVERFHPRAIRDHDDDIGRIARCCRRIEDRLEVGAAPRHEHGNGEAIGHDALRIEGTAARPIAPCARRCGITRSVAVPHVELLRRSRPGQSRWTAWRTSGSSTSPPPRTVAPIVSAAATKTMFFRMYCPSSVGTRNPDHVTSGNRKSGVTVPNI